MDYPKKLVVEVLEKAQGKALTGFLTGQGSRNATLMLVGEAPGKIEIQTKIPFTGRSGKKLDVWLELADLKREDIYITSAVRNRPYKIVSSLDKKTGKLKERRPNRAPTQQEVWIHASLLDYEIQTVRPKILAPMGNIGLKRLLGGKYKIADIHGELMESTILQVNQEKTTYENSAETYLIFPLYHPAAVFYNPALENLIEQDWEKLGHLVNNI
ncbi:uracil-DNA glycosylase [Vagococcus elongatus]|uniref:Uracil-DNA glycosylase n=1 Tax=Vagococcus elongatus TaxID=180344 RepID=A0A430AMT8_9ENTE|nr:uracil-DNA glycosylase [Vagococcus elongatus]RSU09470.1 uracil-DNA glycosylase [Vagococcus elongatus]